MYLLLNAIGLFVAIYLIFKSSDYFIEGATSVAVIFNMPQLVVGVFIVGFGTSAPEMLISTSASLKGLAGIAIGNVIGSNIANVALVLGVAATITPITITRKTLAVETVIMLVATCVAVFLMAYDHTLNIIDGYILIALLILALFITFKNTKPEKVETTTKPLAQTILYIVLGGGVLIGSVEILVWTASNIATFLGISDTLIGLTIVALGSSLPELAVTINACFKKHTDLVVGNILGSNLFNLLAVLPIPALLTIYTIPPELIKFDLMLMMGLAFFIPIAVLINFRKMQLNRIFGLAGICCYLFYIGFKIYETV